MRSEGRRAALQGRVSRMQNTGFSPRETINPEKE
jgi:hypothetical protein